ncbi:CHASE3 domain-containing protein [Methylocella sp.]|uniref:CHASE3 domain-containing protein n=1 Tax=Methylocella sp. TaxID=1978226 RepID=UPI003783B55B
MKQAQVFSLSRTLGAAMAAIALTVILTGVANFGALRELSAAIDARTRSLEMIRALDALRSSMLDQEAGIRGHLLARDANSLEPYRDGAAAFERAVVDLRAKLADAPAQSALFAEAEAAARAWQVNVAQKILAAPESEARGLAEDIERAGEGRRRFDAFREKLAAIERAENRNLTVQSETVARVARRATVVSVLGALVVLVICGLVALAVRRLIVDPLTTRSGRWPARSKCSA